MKNIRIGARLGLGFSVVMVLLALTTWLSLICLSSQNATTHSITKVAYRKSEAAAKITLLVTDIGRVSRNLILQSTPASLKKNKATFDANKQAIEAQMSVIESRINNDDERTMFNTLRSHQGEYFTFVDRIASLALSGDKQGATDYLFAASNAQMQGQYVTALSAVTKFEDAQIETLANDSNSAYQMARLYVASAALLALILATISGWYIARSVTAPLRDAVGVAARISEGRLDAAIRPGHRDETGQLLNALSQMQGNLVKTVRLVRDNSENVATASSEIAQGNLDLSQRTEEQAASVAQTASSMAELTDSVKRNTENAVRASALSSKASEMAARGNDAVGQVAATMGDITRESRQVANIVGVIESIAFQTNILALNAAVEAARAGAEGRGFAVVANEVRTLAQRSAAAAKEIKSLIDASGARIAEGEALVGNASGTMAQVVDTVQQVTGLVGEITSASEEQQRGIEQVNLAVMQMDAVTQQNAALVEQASAATQSLSGQADTLRASVSVFRLAHG
ncbi:methyl-accepting chemotaxis protein [Robbsia andropogonis]|uniref:methyl-accepting chemotaxis protein n=1 Tax=Robbsia andropogonis TaxID=28092 RepID=UPI0004632434|nr:methyl-accepting chemotaxis protein [Robbsia andropogonis]